MNIHMEEVKKNTVDVDAQSTDRYPPYSIRFDQMYYVLY